MSRFAVMFKPYCAKESQPAVFLYGFLFLDIHQCRHINQAKSSMTKAEIFTLHLLQSELHVSQSEILWTTYCWQLDSDKCNSHPPCILLCALLMITCQYMVVILQIHSIYSCFCWWNTFDKTFHLKECCIALTWSPRTGLCIFSRPTLRGCTWAQRLYNCFMACEVEHVCLSLLVCNVSPLRCVKLMCVLVSCLSDCMQRDCWRGGQGSPSRDAS